MATANVLSANVLKQITGISGKQYKKVAWHTAELVVRQFLDVQEYMNLIHQIISDCKKPDGSIAFADAVLERARVFIVPGVIFGSNGDRYVRLSLCATQAKLREALERAGVQR